MTFVRRWGPLEDLLSAQQELARMNCLLAEALGQDRQRQRGATGSPPAWAPTLDLGERTGAYLLTVELAGSGLDGIASCELPVAALDASRPKRDHGS